MAQSDPQFVSLDPALITSSLVAQFEEISGKTLYPAQYERLFIDLMAYLSVLNRTALQEACKQQLVRFSQAPILDHLGDLVGVRRLGAQGAQTTLQISLTAALPTDKVIAYGYAVQTRDGAATFATLQTLVIPAGSTQGQTLAVCQTPGSASNGYQPGDVCVPLQTMDGIAGAMNSTTTSGGSESETDDHLRQRILDAPETFSVAGPSAAYEALAKNVRPDIIDVATISLVPGTITIYPLLASGLPGSDLLDLVQAALSAETVRPLCDTVAVLAPAPVPFAINAQVTLYSTADPTATMAAVQAAANTYAQGRSSGLGRSLIESQVVAALSVPGVYKVVLVGWTDQVLSRSQWATNTSIVVTLVGLANG